MYVSRNVYARYLTARTTMGLILEQGPFVVGKNLTVLFPCDRDNYSVDAIVVGVKTEAYLAVSCIRAVSPCAKSASHPNSLENQRLDWQIETKINFACVAAVPRLLSTSVAAIIHITNRASPSGLITF